MSLDKSHKDKEKLLSAYGGTRFNGYNNDRCKDVLIQHLCTAASPQNVVSTVSLPYVEHIATGDKQFARLKDFLCGAVDPYRRQLKMLLYPVFVHVYLEMVRSGQRQAVNTFYLHHLDSFRGWDQCSDILQTLASVKLPQDVVKHPRLVKFVESRFILDADDEAVDYLVTWLSRERSSNALLLEILNEHVLCPIQHDSSRVASSASRLEVIIPPRKAPPPPSAPYPPECAEPVTVPVEDREQAAMLTWLEGSIEEVRRSPPSVPHAAVATIVDSDSVACVTVAPDNTTLACGGDDSAIRLFRLAPRDFDAASGSDTSHVRLSADTATTTITTTTTTTTTTTLRGHRKCVLDVCFAGPDMLVSGSQDGDVRLWQVRGDTGDTHPGSVAVYPGHSYPVYSVDVARTCTMFATGSADNTCRVFSCDRPLPLRVLSGHRDDVDRVRFHPNTTLLCTASVDGSLRLWDVNDARCVRVLSTTAARGTTHAVTFSPCGQRLVTAGEERVVRVWDLRQMAVTAEMVGHTDWITAVALPPGGGGLLASCGADRTLHLWDSWESPGGHLTPVYSLPVPRDAAPNCLHSVRYPTAANLLQIISS